MQNLHFLWKNTHHPKPSKSKLTKLALKAALYSGLPEDYPWDLDVMFVEDVAMAEYNEEIVGHTGTTDVITLSYFDSDDFIDFEIEVAKLSKVKDNDKTDKELELEFSKNQIVTNSTVDFKQNKELKKNNPNIDYNIYESDFQQKI